jgi:hypothetical protein
VQLVKLYLNEHKRRLAIQKLGKVSVSLGAFAALGVLVIETSVQYVHLTRLIAREDYIKLEKYLLGHIRIGVVSVAE